MPSTRHLQLIDLAPRFLVIRAREHGMCFGVRDALDAMRSLPEPESVTVFGELVHNERVLAELADRGFRSMPEDDRAAVPDTPRVLITAHGVSDRERHRLERAGRTLVDTTCPLVRRAHAAARRLQERGYRVVVVGRPGHVEVEGLTGDLEDPLVLARPEDARPVDERRVGVVAQTTTPPEHFAAVLDALRRANPEVEIAVVDTICAPTRDRIAAVEELAGRVEAVVVVGGRSSNNTRRLARRAEQQGVTAFHVQGPDDLDPSWFASCRRAVGLTAGTSTLPETVDAVAARLAAIARG